MGLHQVTVYEEDHLSTPHRHTPTTVLIERQAQGRLVAHEVLSCLLPRLFARAAAESLHDKL
jgi:hypothetical protein